MKDCLKRFFSFYLNTWWMPPLLFALGYVVFLWPENHQRPDNPSLTQAIMGAIEGVACIVGYLSMLPLTFGVPIAWGWLLAKQRYRAMLWSFLTSIAIYLLIPFIVYPIINLFYRVYPS